MSIPTIKARAAATINLVGGRLCLDFVNTIGARRVSASGQLTIRDEKLTNYEDLVAWACHAGALDASEAKSLTRASAAHPQQAGRALSAALRLREALYGIFKKILAGLPPDRADMAILNQQLQAARSSEVLAAGKEGFAWKWNANAPDFNRILWAVTLSAVKLLTTDDLRRLRQCGGDDCGWIFLDLTRNRSRHWCDMRDCGNRDRVRRFRLRQRRRARVSRRLIN